MKNFILFIATLFVIGCGGDTVKNPAPSANPDAHAGHHHADGDHAGHDHAGHDHATDDPNIVTNPDGTVHVKGDMTAFLVGLWEVQFALVGANTKVDDRYNGVWIDMQPDFSFTSGVYDQQTNQGTYSFRSEPDRTINFTFKNEEKLLPAEATIKGFAVQLVLLGKTALEGKRTQLKIGQTSKKPTRPQ